jgi:hypothetical protein
MVLLDESNITALGVIGAHASAYPKSVLRDSYFLNGLCGGETNRACPGPAIPNPRGNSAYITVQGGAGR